MDRVIHHGVVDQVDAYPLAEFEWQGFGVRELDPVHRPHVATHVSGKVQVDLPLRFTRIVGRAESEQVRIGEYAPAIVA